MAMVLPLQLMISGSLTVFCSAVTVAPHLVVTEAHCIDGLEEDQVYADGVPLTLVRRDEGLALLRARDTASLRWVPETLVPHLVVAGDPVRAVGWAFGQGETETRGVVAGTCLNGDLFFDLTVIRGMSGGAIYDEHGHLITLVRGSMTDGQDTLAFSPPPKALAHFLDK